MLSGAGLLDKAHPTMHLQGQSSNFIAHFGTPPLDDWNQHINPTLPLDTLGGVGVVTRAISSGRCIQ
mgnify:CR=1 FL=1